LAVAGGEVLQQEHADTGGGEAERESDSPGGGGQEAEPGEAEGDGADLTPAGQEPRCSAGGTHEDIRPGMYIGSGSALLCTLMAST
jgi:hypothetical protein